MLGRGRGLPTADSYNRRKHPLGYWLGWKYDVRQAGAAGKSPLPDVGDAGRDCHAGQAGAVSESPIPDDGNRARAQGVGDSQCSRVLLVKAGNSGLAGGVGRVVGVVAKSQRRRSGPWGADHAG
jgi:hypothetical protein